MKVVYIAGYGRSGSTLLNAILGAQENWFGAGELCNLASDAWAADEFCACGQRASRCEFWTKVRKRFEDSGGVPADYQKLSGAIELRQNPFLLKDIRRIDKKLVREYATSTRLLFEAIESVSGAEWLVDSSKSPARAWALSFIEDFELYVVHLVRDGRSVAGSLKRGLKKAPERGVQRDLPARSIVRTAFAWASANHLVDRVRARLSGRVLRIRYEDLVCNPSNEVQRIGQWLDLDVNEIVSRIEQEEPIRIAHVVAGNRLRMQKELRIRRDLTKPKTLTRSEYLLSTLLGWPWLAEYGYRTVGKGSRGEER